MSGEPSHIAAVRRGEGYRFQARLRDLGLSQAAFARLLRDLGDRSDTQTIERRIRRWTAGKARVPGEAIALLTLIERVRAAAAPLATILPVRG